MNRKHHRQTTRTFGDGLQESQQLLLSIYICRAMQGDHKVVVQLKLERFPTGWWARELLEQRIDHRVADEEDAIVRDTGAAKIVVGGFAGSEKPVRDGIGHDPVYFLWHGPI